MDDWTRIKLSALKATDRDWPRAWVTALLLVVHGPLTPDGLVEKAVSLGLSPRTVKRGLRILEEQGIVERNRWGLLDIKIHYKAVVRATLNILDWIKDAFEGLDLERLERVWVALDRLEERLAEQGELSWFTRNLVAYLRGLCDNAIVQVMRQRG